MKKRNALTVSLMLVILTFAYMRVLYMSSNTFYISDLETKESMKGNFWSYDENLETLVLDDSELEEKVTDVVINNALYIGNEIITETSVGEGWRYNRDTRTLYLDNFQANTAISHKYYIYSAKDLTIVLSGESNFVFDSENALECGIYVNGTLKIEGAGYLNIENVQTGIRTNSGLILDKESKVNIDSSEASVIVEKGSLFVYNRAELKVDSVIYNDDSSTDIYVTNGVIEAKTIIGQNHLHVDGDSLVKGKLLIKEKIAVNGGKIESTIRETEGENSIAIETKYILIEDGEIIVENLAENDKSRTIGIASANIEVKAGKVIVNASGIGIEGTLNQSGGKVEINGSSALIGINGRVNLRNGDLKISDFDYGIVSCQFVVNGGLADIRGFKNGIYGYNESETKSTLSINGGEVTIVGGECAIADVNNYLIRDDYGVYVGNSATSSTLKDNYTDELYVNYKKVIRSLLTIDLDGGEYSKELVYKKFPGETIELDVPSKKFTVTIVGDETTKKDVDATFVEWNLEGSGSLVDNIYTFDSGSAEIKAIWTYNTINLEASSREGYIFEGWYTDVDYTELFDENLEITNDMTVYAKFTEEKLEPTPSEEYSLELDLDGGEYEGNTYYVGTPGETIDLIVPAKSFEVTIEAGSTIVRKVNATFAGWCLIGGGSIEDNKYTFGEESGKLIAEWIYNTIDLHAPVKEGLKFAGWYTDKEYTIPFATGTRIMSLMTLYAKYTPIYQKGDVNNDGRISALDYIKIMNHIMETNPIIDTAELEAADVNEDGVIDALDYIIIKNHIMNGEA